MIQYKHASIAAYEGYAGSSRSGFRNEVERERALGQLDDVLTYFERHRAGEVLMGPAAARISDELQQAVDKLAPFPATSPMPRASAPCSPTSRRRSSSAS